MIKKLNFIVLTKVVLFIRPVIIELFVKVIKFTVIPFIAFTLFYIIYSNEKKAFQNKLKGIKRTCLPAGSYGSPRSIRTEFR